MIYENNTAKLLLTEAGYVSLNDNKYHYYLKDHQGNNRVVVNQSGSVEETNHYYPFGGVFASTNIQPYKYNGKELDSKKGLNWYDYGARYYDAALGRFIMINPLTEYYDFMQPYNYCFNNPIKFIDPTGKLPSPIYDENGKLLGTDDRGLQGKAIIMNKSNFEQGMPHKDDLKFNLGYQGLATNEAKATFMTSYKSLSNRQDYDGYLTKAEADDWWKGKSGEPLYVDQSKIELHGINTSSFNKRKSIYKNFIWRLTNTGKVYGTLRMTLIDARKGKVKIGTHSKIIWMSMILKWMGDCCGILPHGLEDLEVEMMEKVF